MGEEESEGGVSMIVARRDDGADNELTHSPFTSQQSVTPPSTSSSIAVAEAIAPRELWQPQRPRSSERAMITPLMRLTLWLVRVVACNSRDLRDALHPNQLPVAAIPTVRRLRWVFLVFALIFLMSWPFLCIGLVKSVLDFRNYWQSTKCAIPVQPWLLVHMVFMVFLACCLLPIWALLLTLFLVALVLPFVSFGLDPQLTKCVDILQQEAFTLMPSDVAALVMQVLAFALVTRYSRPHVRRLFRLCRHRGPTPPEVVARVAELVPRGRLPADMQCTICYGTYDEDASGEGEAWRGLPCGHAFHEHCLYQWLRRSPRCPNCRGSLLTADVAGIDSSETSTSEAA